MPIISRVLSWVKGANHYIALQRQVLEFLQERKGALYTAEKLEKSWDNRKRQVDL